MKITLPYNMRVDSAVMPTTGIIIEVNDDVDATATYSRDGTFTLILNDGCDCEPDDACGNSNVIGFPSRNSKVESRSVIAPAMGGKVG